MWSIQSSAISPAHSSVDGCQREHHRVNAASWVTATGVIVALVIGVGTVVQRWRADRGAQWWSRTQWALDLSLTADDYDKVELGLDVVEYILDSNISSREQAKFLKIAAERILSQRRQVDAQDERDADER
jgi:hypothetical protein